MPKATFLHKSEILKIRDECLSKTDEQLAKELGRDIRTIANARKKLGITKSTGGKVKALVAFNKTSSTQPTIPDHKLTTGLHLNESQRKEFFKTQLVNSLYYQNLKEQFTENEIDFYLEEWGALSIQFDDIANTEKRQIDDLIKAEIMGNRMLRNIKVAEDIIENLQLDVEALRKSKDMDTDVQAQERDDMLNNMIRAIHSQTQVMANDYQRNFDLRSKVLSELNARRRDRVDQIKKGGTTFIGLVEAFRDRQLRATQGRHIELVRIAREKKRVEWNKPNIFPDGTKDCILMDENSELVQKDIIRIEELGSQFLQKYQNLENKRIFILDDDQSRQQFFAQILIKNKLDFASNTIKAKLLLIPENKYDFICLDYDLGLNQKGHEVVDYILNNNLYKDTEFLIHSMNPEGVERMQSMLSGERIIEVCNFETILKSFKKEESNA
jgi:CheY-like chemotaxis protein